MLYPINFEHKIDFVTIRKLLKEKCLSTLGEENVDQIQFSSQYSDVLRLLYQTNEMLHVITTNAEDLPVGDFFDVRPALSRIRVEGLYMDELEIFTLRKSLDAVRLLVAFITNLDETIYPNLLQIASGVETFSLIIHRIDSILNKFGKVKDNASQELDRIRREIFKVQSSVSKTLHSILRQAQADGYVERDAVPTLREGRLVIPVTPGYKRKVSGIVHDESATGKTVFVEPQQVVEANNQLRELEGDERREIAKILLEFTNFVRPFNESIISSQFFLGQIDFLRAKALFAIETRALMPKIDDLCVLEWSKARHPLLYMSLKKQSKDIVPLDIYLNETQRILLISGPNAGGKSVCLKTVVLLQYMLQCGLLIPVHHSSRAGVFERLFIDIGDEQSIENDLSTYSSHLLNMKFFIKNSNSKTLLLIDEFGTGTEPHIGGAIAEATLDRFNRNKSFAVITTHYTNLKHYAEDAQGIVNGAMLYDRQHLQPLFQLSIGNPGSSFAVEIARKIGLPEDLISEAAHKVGTEHLDYDKHLQDIVRDKRYWENKRQQIRQKEKKLEETLARYESEMDNLDNLRKEVNNKAKEEAKNLLSAANARIESTIRKIIEANAEKLKTKSIRTDFQNFRNEVLNGEPDKILNKKLPAKRKSMSISSSNSDISKVQANFIVGANIRLKGQVAVGIILEIQNNQAVVAFGQMKSTVKLSSIEMVSNNQIKKEKHKYDQLALSKTDEVRQRKLTFSSDIDVRGMRGDEALQAVMYYIDDAVIVGVTTVRILHGTGSGILRQLIRQYLSTLPEVKKFRDEHVQLGGAGITVVEFD